ncbi:MAG: hypothetical protein RBU37_20550 [Myxococcota bacterium]|nr:hypothetical protein [Myxococcota bacterium]
MSKRWTDFLFIGRLACSPTFWMVVLCGLLVASIWACDSDESADGDSSVLGDTSSQNDTPQPDGATLDTSNPHGDGTTYGQVYSGGEFHLGPVDYAETKWHNACAADGGYLSEVQGAEGVLLAGVWNGLPEVASLCDACIAVETEQGKSALLRVVTYGSTTTNGIDVSPEAYAVLDSGEYPRLMSWKLTKCPDTGPVMYEFKTGAHEWWTAFWVRNARVPLKRVEVKSVTHTSFDAISHESDGSLADYAGFGAGPFTIRLTGIDDQVIEHSFDWPSGGIGGALLSASSNFQ